LLSSDDHFSVRAGAHTFFFNVLEQRKKFSKDHSLLKAEIRADMEREAKEREEAEKNRNQSLLTEKARLRLEEVIRELQS
jgi:hypothetical protein